jgi:hypothetical protein
MAKCVPGPRQVYGQVGEAGTILVIAPSIKGNYHSTGAKPAVQTLAQIIANLHADLRDEFEAALIREKARRAREDARLPKAGPQR